MTKTNSLAAVAARKAKPKQDAPAEDTTAPESKARRRGNTPREDTRLIGGHFPVEYQKRMRLLAAMENCSIQALIKEALDDLFLKKNV